MKRLLSLLMAVMLIFIASVCTVYAETIASGTNGSNITWSIDENGLLTIDGEGIMSLMPFSATPWNSYKTEIKNVEIKSGITSIGVGAFRYCNNIESISIPSSVKSIGYWAFWDCSSLTSITIPKGVSKIDDSTFYNCTSLTDVTIPDTVTSINETAFYGCTSLTNIHIPDSVTNIGEDAFSECGNLSIQCNKGSYADEYAASNSISVSYINENSNTFVFKLESSKAYYVSGDAVVDTTVSCQLIDGKTYVPFRMAASAVGITDIKYDEATSSIVFTGCKGYNVKMALNSTGCELTASDGSKMNITISAPVMIDGVTCLPVRDISNLTRGSVKYDAGYILVSPEAIDDTKVSEFKLAFESAVA